MLKLLLCNMRPFKDSGLKNLHKITKWATYTIHSDCVKSSQVQYMFSFIHKLYCAGKE